MIDKRTKATGRSGKISSFSMLIHAYFQSDEYAQLSSRAVKLLIDLYCQYRGNNNGDLCATLSIMKKVGWTSNDQLQKALAELLATGWIVVVRVGGRRLPHLYALTFHKIDATGKLDSHIKPGSQASNLWRAANRKDVLLDATMTRTWEKISTRATSSYRSAHFCSPSPGTKLEASMLH